MVRRQRRDVAGLDVHRDTVVAAVHDDRDEYLIKTFGTTTADLLELRDWLIDHEVGLVAMESTGVYWKPVWSILEQSLECWLLNAKHLHHVPGRKSDVQDCQWIGDLVEHGLVRPSLVPTLVFRQLRDLTRYRKSTIEEQNRYHQRLHKILEDAGVKLASFTSKVLTMSGRDMIEALIAGERDPAVLAQMARGRMRPKIPDLERALYCHWNEHHSLLASEILARIDDAERQINRVSDRIAELIAPWNHHIELLCTIPGVDRRTAEVILAEIGVDMTLFPTAGHLVSWAGLCPGTNESAGKSAPGDAAKATAGSSRP